jgi:lipopolysaccharide export system protein LptA
MRRISVLLAVAALCITGVVGYTYKLRLDKLKGARAAPTPKIKNGYEAQAPTGWRYRKDDPQTGKPIVRVEAKAFQATHDPSTFELQALALRLYNKDGASYTYVKTDQALFNEGSGILKAAGPVSMVINVPADRDAEDKNEAAKRVRVTTTGVTYETKTGKATTDQPASFVFTEGDGRAVGADYDPNTKILHLKSQIALDWIGHGTADKKMHIEAGDLIYKEAEQKIYLSPWSKLQRQTTTIQAQNSVVVLEGGRLHQVDAEHPFGTDDRENRHTDYSADHMTGLFDEDGNLVQIVGQKNARVVASEPGSRTVMTGDRADLRFALDPKQRNGVDETDSVLHLVLANGHAVAESMPLPQPGVQLAETRILRSEHIELEMKPGGQEVQEIRTPSAAQLEFKPNRPDQSHRFVYASHLRVVYGESSYVDEFQAWNVSTHTDKPAAPKNPAHDGKPTGPPAPALTWSDQMLVKFTPNTNQVANIEQSGNFRYEEGARKAWSKKAFIDQTINKITLIDSARVLDETGSAIADTIVMNQATGDMDASGHVVSTHQPDPKQKPGTSMLDEKQPMQAKADKMQTRENNTKVHYEGHALMWQGASRIAANVIDIDRDEQSLHATGDVVSELVDNKQTQNASPAGASSSTPPASSQPSAQNQPAQAPSQPPVFTTVRAPEVFYRDDTRIALYTGGVKLTRDKMTVTSKQIKAFLNPKDENNSNQSSLDHAFADGSVSIFEVVSPGRTRTGTSEHCEYYAKEDKVVLNGGSPQMVDTYKGITKGRQLTYYSGDDHLIVEGENKQLAYTRMKKR